MSQLKRFKYGYKYDEWGMNMHLGLIEAPDGMVCMVTDAEDAIAAARVQAIEEVVALCDPDELGLEQGDDCATGVYRVEKAIHALIGKEAT